MDSSLVRSAGLRATIALLGVSLALSAFPASRSNASTRRAGAGPRGTAAEAARQVAAAPVPTLSWRDCNRGFECARASVPLDYDRPLGASISLRLIRLPASDPARRRGSIFLNPGGPGGSGVGFVRNVGKQLFTPAVRARFDLVGFDPRGIAFSTQIRCFETTEDALDVLPPFDFPFTRRQEDRWIAFNRAYAEACTRRAGAIIDHMSSANVARDIDLLRRALDDNMTNFVGYSYGSVIGSTYANLFPDRVRAVIIDGVIDPVSWSTGRGDEAETLPVDARLQSEQGAFETLQQFLSLCDRGAEECAFSAGDPRRRYAQLARRLIEQPAELPDGSVITYNDLVSITLGAMYNPSSWPDLARFLSRLYRLTRPRAVAAALRELRSQLGSKAREPYFQVFEGFAGVTCSDTDNPESFDAWRRAARAADRQYPYFGRIWNWSSSICAVWPGQDSDRYTGPYTAVTANPVLVVGTRFDPATRYQDAVSTAGILGRARLLTLEGWGHTSLFASTCIDGYVAAYLVTGALPPRGAACHPDVVPFSEATPANASLRAELPVRPPVLPAR